MLRITGGIFRGRLIQTPHHEKTRPTQSRLRQALFNSLQTRIGEAKVLDLFAGAGTLGFEALSRGASEVTFVESSKSALRMIEKNSETLKITEQVKILRDSVSSTSVASELRRLGPFDLVLADPPYEAGWEMKLLEGWPGGWSWEEILAEGGYFCLEWGKQKSQVKELPDRLPFLAKCREKDYGDSVLTTYERI